MRSNKAGITGARNVWNYICIVFCSFANQLSACARQIKCYINSDPSPVVDTTYRDLRQFVDSIDMSRYFECDFAGSQLVDISSCDNFEVKTLDVNIHDNGHHSSGFYVMYANSASVPCFVVMQSYYYYYYNCFTAHCVGPPGWAGTRRITILDFTEAEMMR